MKRSSALFLQAAIVVTGVATLGLMLWEPHIEGRNAHATTFEIYFIDPFLAYVYIGSIPFFVALHRAFGLLGDVRQNGTFSRTIIDALRVFKRCAMTIICFVAGAVVFIIIFGDNEDRPAGVFMCLLVTFASGIIAAAAAIVGRQLQNALMSSE